MKFSIDLTFSETIELTSPQKYVAVRMYIRSTTYCANFMTALFLLNNIEQLSKSKVKILRKITVGLSSKQITEMPSVSN